MGDGREDGRRRRRRMRRRVRSVRHAPTGVAVFPRKSNASVKFCRESKIYRLFLREVSRPKETRGKRLHMCIWRFYLMFEVFGIRPC